MQKVAEKKTESALKLKYILRLLFLALVIAILFISQKTNKNIACDGRLISTGRNYICATVADDNNKRTLGLSGTKYLAPSQGMLFIFDFPGNHGIWMKDMLIPLDILWLNETKYVVHIEKNITPDTYPKIYSPGTEAKYVIELPIGSADSLNINKGDRLYW